MRVIGGEWRGRRLVTPAGRFVRPTSDKVREAIFDVLTSLLMERGEGLRAALATQAAPAGLAAQTGPADLARQPAPAALGEGPFAGLEVADLYAGSGALGIEALSRGAARCTFVERDRAALAALRTNLAALGLTDERARLVPGSVAVALAADAAQGRRYTLVLADPPYAAWAEAERDLAPFMQRLLAPGALAAVETARGVTIHWPLQVLRLKQYGSTQVTVLAHGAVDPADGVLSSDLQNEASSRGGEGPCPTK
jgi:16S rRNA (guanine966-N2)-methyltransferase